MFVTRKLETLNPLRSGYSGARGAVILPSLIGGRVSGLGLGFRVRATVGVADGCMNSGSLGFEYPNMP